MPRILHQFASSHFNEKARWALDWKGLEYERVTYLPGPHVPAIKKLSGQSSTPVLEWDGEIVAGSAAIVDHLERLQPEPSLYPADPAERAKALDVQRHFDAEVGPAVRAALFSVLLREGAYFSRVFTKGKGSLTSGFYRATVPLARKLISQSYGLDDAAKVEADFARTQDALDRLAKEVRETGHVVGERFSVADLAAASLLAPLVRLEHPDMARPAPVPDAIARFEERWAAHPAIAWVRDVYARHRPVR